MSSRPNINLAEAIAMGGQVIFHDADWDGYQRFRKFFEKEGYGRVAYCDGLLEIMGNESQPHEIVSYILGHLIGSYAMSLGREVYGTGSALIGSKQKDAGKNPDESFWFDRDPVENEGPDLVVEVVLTTEAISKQTFYAKFDVPEFWIWEEGKLTVYLLKSDGKGYKKSKTSQVFPDLDLKLMERCSNMASLSKANIEFERGVRNGAS